MIFRAGKDAKEKKQRIIQMLLQQLRWYEILKQRFYFTQRRQKEKTQRMKSKHIVTKMPFSNQTSENHTSDIIPASKSSPPNHTSQITNHKSIVAFTARSQPFFSAALSSSSMVGEKVLSICHCCCMSSILFQKPTARPAK